MMAALLLLSCAGLPSWLSAPSPGEALRWTEATTEPAAPGVLHVQVGAVPALRFDGPFGGECELHASLVTGTGPLARQPLTLNPSAGQRLLVVPAWVPRQRDAPPVVEVTGCLEHVVAWQARLEPLEYGLAEVANELRALARVGPSPAFEKEATGFPAAHRWQREAAWALTFPSALEALPGDAEATRAVREALVERVILEARRDDPTFGESQPLEAATPGRRLGSGNGVWRLLRPADELHTALDGDVLHLSTRVAAQPRATSWRVAVRFDDGPEVVLTGLAAADPAVPGLTHQRADALLVPPGVRVVHLRALDSEVWWRGYASRRRPHLEDALTGRGPAASLRRAAQLAGDAPRSRLVRAWARTLEGDGAALAEARALTRGHAELSAWLAVMTAERASNEARGGALAEAWPTVKGGDPTGVLANRLVTLELQQGLGLHREAEVLDAWAAHFDARQPTVEAALDLAEFEAQAPPELDTAPSKALEVLDALLERFPLDPDLEVARARHFALATAWAHVSAPQAALDDGALEPLEGDALRGPERALLGRVPADGSPLALDVPRALLPGRLATVDCVVERGVALPRLLPLRFDNRLVTFPALQRRGQFSVALTPGVHHVSLEAGEGAIAAWCSFAVSPTARLRRYLLADPQRPVVFSLPPDARLAQLTVRRAAGDTAPLELKVREAGGVETPISVSGGDGVLGVTFPATGRATSLSVVASAPVRLRLAVRTRRVAHDAPGSGSVRGGGTAALTLAPDGGDGVEARLQRAATLLELDEVALAREDLLAASEARQATGLADARRRRALLRQLWRTADELGGAGAASVPDEGALDVPVSLAQGEQGLSVGLISLADDDAFLRSASPELLRKRAGTAEGGDLALWLAASVATQEGEAERAAAL